MPSLLLLREVGSAGSGRWLRDRDRAEKVQDEQEGLHAGGEERGRDTCHGPRCTRRTRSLWGNTGDCRPATLPWGGSAEGQGDKGDGVVCAGTGLRATSLSSLSHAALGSEEKMDKRGGCCVPHKTQTAVFLRG